MMPRQAALGVNRALAGLRERARAISMRTLARYLATPLGQFSTLTSADRQALATVLRRGDVLLSSGNTRFAALVKRLTRSTWSHVSMYVGPLKEEFDPPCVVEADIVHGVRCIRLSQLNARHICVLRPVGLDDADRERLAACVLGHLGSPYDIVQAWGLARSLFARRRRARLRAWPQNMERRATRFICSSLITQAFAVAGHSILLADAPVAGREAALVPADFARASRFAVVWPVSARETYA